MEQQEKRKKISVALWCVYYLSHSLGMKAHLPQSAIKASANKSKKDKKKPKKNADSVAFADGPPPGEGSDGEAERAKGDITAPQKAVEMTAEELADEEWGPVKQKGKGKKGKGKASKQKDAEEIVEEKEGVSRFSRSPGRKC